jgi:O-antigen/teichoic acid export membrane protein
LSGSAVARIVSGSAASWSRLAVGFASQLAVVPVFLSHWEPATYGVWLSTMALAALIQFLDNGHQNYVGFEALRLGAERRAEIARLYAAAVRVAVGASVVELVAIAAAVKFGLHSHLLGIAGQSASLMTDAGVLLLLHVTSWLLFGNWSTVAGRVLVPYGYYAPIAWVQVIGAIISAAAPACAVALGGGLLTAGFAYHVAYSVYSLAAVIYLKTLIRRERLDGVRAEYAFGMKNYSLSVGLSFRSLLDMLRQDQFKIVVAPLVGAASLTLFVTTRTVANVFITGLNTVTGPLTPELLRYVNRTDAEKSAAVMSVLWIVLVGVLAPAAVAAQLLVAPLFEIWTRGRVPFDHTLFALFSMSVLFVAFAQPAIAVIQGLNKVRLQVGISLMATASVIIGTLLLAPAMGTVGAAGALLVGEVLLAFATLSAVRGTFRDCGISWPRRQATVAAAALLFTCVLIVLAARTQGMGLPLALASLACAAAATFLIVDTLPREIRVLTAQALMKVTAQRVAISRRTF